MNDFYRDREQSQAKHEILRRYLTPFANKILHAWPSIDFIDGFAGPWENRDEDGFSDTSIGIALETLSRVAEQRGHSPNAPQIRCIFNEASPPAFRRLEAFAERAVTQYPLVQIEIFRGEFEANAQRIKASAKNAFQLLFVDPTGYTGFSPGALSVFSGRSTEIVVNFMRSFIVRFVSGNHRDREQALCGLIGRSRANKLLKGELSVEAIEMEYLLMLKEDLAYKYRYGAFSPIHNPDRNEIHFLLAYATNHPDGMEAMRSAEFTALTEHDKNRFKRAVKSRGDDLFGDMLDEMEVTGPYLKVRKRHLAHAAENIRAAISQSARPMEFTALAAEVQQSLYLKRSEIGDAIVELSRQGVVKPTWRERQGRRPRADDLIVLCE